MFKIKKSAYLQRLPRECGGLVDDKFPARVNNISGIELDHFVESFFTWIPAFARKMLESDAFLKSRNLSKLHV